MLLYSCQHNFISSERRRSHNILQINYDEITNHNTHEIIRLYNPYFEETNVKGRYEELILGIIIIILYFIFIIVCNLKF